MWPQPFLSAMPSGSGMAACGGRSRNAGLHGTAAETGGALKLFGDRTCRRDRDVSSASVSCAPAQ